MDRGSGGRNANEGKMGGEGMSGLERIAQQGGSLPQGWVGMEWVIQKPVDTSCISPIV